MKRLRLIVLGTVAAEPYAGMAWMHMQIAAGLQRLGGADSQPVLDD